jgi:uncharacterized protein (DUF1810 family)
MTVDNPYDLERFVGAQDLAATYADVVGELRRGRKTGHWMWFVFPQIAGLGRSATSRYYAISSLEEARAYLAHPILGPRLVECSTIVAASEATSASEVFGELDTQKLRSSMTLFLRAARDEPVFRQVLDRYFAGLTDPATEARL